MTKSLFLCLFGILSFNYAQGQQGESLLRLKTITGENQEWIELSVPEKQSASQFISNYKSELGIPPQSTLEVVRIEKDPSEWVHHRFQQYYKGIKIQGAEFMIHEYKHAIHALNGNIAREIEMNTFPGFDAKTAVQKAIALQPSSKFLWDADPHAYPEAELLILDKAHPGRSGEYALAYRIDVYSLEPLQKTRFYLDAQSGEVLLSHNILQACFGGNGTAHTLYHGIREINTEQVSSDFVLIDNTRGNGIETQSASGLAYSDLDNVWESGSFAQKVGALDVHYGAQSTYDFYKTYLNRDGIDGKNSRLLNKVIDTTVYVNAFWDGTGTNFGIGDNVNTGPLTSLDVVAHEMTHGLTQHTCGLEYLYESGALNEGFSDIFGKAVEYEYDSAQFNWMIGQRFFFKPDTAFRSMENPNRFRNPKMYKGRYWVANSSDNGGVHTNSGVINYWFYLLAEGGSGTNEAGTSFDVKKMGIKPTIDLVYQVMKNYLNSTSYYYDVRKATLTVAENSYGKCSDEYRNIAEAWKAVGIGKGVNEGDVFIVNNKIPQVACKEGLYPVSIRLVNQSCDQIIPKDSDIKFTINVPQKNPIVENYTTTEDILPGQDLKYDFISPARIDRTNITIQVSAVWAGDTDTSNNRISILISKNNNSDHDFRVNNASVIGSSCEGNVLRGQIQSTFNGCTPVPVGTDLLLRLKSESEEFQQVFKTTTTLFPGANYRTPRFDLQRTFSGSRKILASLEYARDTVLPNNTTLFNAVYIDNSKLGYLEDFNARGFDSSLLAVRLDSFQVSEIQDGISGSEAMVFSGGNIFNPTNRFIPVNGATLPNFFSSNPKFTNSLYLCFHTRDIQKAFLSFDYIQKIGNPAYDSLLTNPQFAAATRVIFRNEQGGAIGNPILIQEASRSATLRNFLQEIPLNGGPVTIEINNIVLEGRLDTSLFSIDTTLDYVLMDNIKITGEIVGTDQSQHHWARVYPNPFSESISLFSDPNRPIQRFELYHVDGSLILSREVWSNQTAIQTGTLQPGYYTLKCFDDLGTLQVFKLVK